MQRGSAAGRYDPNPNGLRAGQVDLALPLRPALAAAPSCLPLGPIGIAVSGAWFFNALDAPRRDAVANEVFDACEGHPGPDGSYHYHHGSPCLPQGGEREHAPLVGWAFDGFGIYGPRGEGGRALTNADLDECHGHVGPVKLHDGSAATVYHYHLTAQFPYTLGCYRGAVTLRLGPQAGGPPPGGPRPDRPLR